MQAKGNHVNISVSPQGDFTYSPSVKHVEPGQVLIWESAQGPFSISFKEGTPFGQLNFHSVKGEEGWLIITGEVRKGGGPGHFHYAVAIYTEGRVFMDAGCPEIIVNIDG